MTLLKCGAVLLCLTLPCAADFSYQETSKITGGSMVRLMRMMPGGKKATEPQVSYVYLKGNKLARVSADSMNIIDLDAETITDVNIDRKQYSVITFAEMAKALEAMSKKMQREMAKHKGKGDAPEVKFDVDIKPTGQSKVIEGFMAKEVLMSMSMASTDPQTGQSGAMRFENSLWQTGEIKNDDIHKFYMKMSQKVQWAPGMRSMAAAMQSQPGMGQGMSKLMAEASKLEGTTLMQVSNVVMVGPDGQPVAMPEVNMPSAGEVAETGANQAATNAAASGIGHATGGRLGGLAGAAAGGMLGGFGRKKKQEEPKPEPPPAQAQQAAPASGKPGSVMEITVEMTNHSRSNVDASKFAIPAGFKEVEHDMKKILREEAGK